jgi:hypothetical protein
LRLAPAIRGRTLVEGASQGAPASTATVVPTGDPACCVVLAATAEVPAAIGVLLFTAPFPKQQEVAATVAGLPPPASFGRKFTRYVLWLAGGGTLKIGLSFQTAAGLPGSYAAAIGPLNFGALSEIVVTVEPPSTASPTGPVVMEGSFAFCR